MARRSGKALIAAVGQHLIIDADDTLWENNIYFERAFDRFCDYLAHSSLTGPEVRAALDEIELINNQKNGYGSHNFGRNMCECFDRLSERDVTEKDRKEVMRFALEIMEHPLELIPGVVETLEHLNNKHRLTLFTKGQPEEQQRKVDISGLSRFFDHVAIVREKDVAAYQHLVNQRGMPKGLTWMIGNSPKSDVNPALMAGINAVYVHHPRTWHLEKTEFVETQGRLLKLNAFSELRTYF
jgi:putative hydrolase of the HAD superfamily